MKREGAVVSLGLLQMRLIMFLSKEMNSSYTSAKGHCSLHCHLITTMTLWKNQSYRPQVITVYMDLTMV